VKSSFNFFTKEGKKLMGRWGDKGMRGNKDPARKENQKTVIKKLDNFSKT